MSTRTAAGARVVFHPGTGTYLHLNASAAMVLDALVASGDRASAAAALSAAASIPVARATADVDDFIGRIGALRRGRTRRLRRLTVRGAAREARRWWSLPVPARLAVLRAGMVLAGIEVGLRALDLPRLAVVLGTPVAGPATGTAAEALPPGDFRALSPRESRALEAARWLGRRWPVEVTCLREALFTGHVLRSRRPVLRLGLMPGGTTAHAWVEADGRAYGTAPVDSMFSPVG